MRWMVVLLGGCNGILGVHDFAAPDGGADSQASVHLFFDRFVENTDGMLIRQRQTLAPDRVRLIDGTALPFQTLGDGSVAIPIAQGTPYQVQFDGAILETEHLQLQLSAVGYGTASHPAPTANTTVVTKLPNDASSNYRLISTPIIGIAAMTPTTDGLGATWTAPPLLADDDRFWIARYTDNAAAGFTTIDRVAEGKATFAPGARTDLPLSGFTIAPRLDAAFQYSFSSQLSRVHALVADATELDKHWTIAAMNPELEHHTSQVLANDIAPPPDGAISLTTANPFTGTTPVAVVSAIALANNHIAQQFLFAPLIDGVAAFTQDCGVPSEVTLDGTLMSSGNEVEIDRAKQVRLAWSVDAPVDFALIVVVDRDTGVTVVAGYSTRNELSIDPTLLLTAHSYFVQILTYAGYPDGDLTTARPAMGLGSYRSEAIRITD